MASIKAVKEGQQEPGKTMVLMKSVLCGWAGGWVDEGEEMERWVGRWEENVWESGWVGRWVGGLGFTLRYST